jgi:hypothetical protein
VTYPRTLYGTQGHKRVDETTRNAIAKHEALVVEL